MSNELKILDKNVVIQELEGKEKALKAELHTTQLLLNAARAEPLEDQEVYERQVSNSLC